MSFQLQNVVPADGEVLVSEDNIVDISSKKTIEHHNLEERISACFYASIGFDVEHKKNCIYCLHNTATGQMIFDILAKDMTLAAKQKNLFLTTFDMRQCLAAALIKINETEHEVAETTSEETRTGRSGEGGGSESGEPEITETGPAVTQGVIEIGSYRNSPKKDRET